MEIKHYVKIMTKGLSIFPNIKIMELENKTLKNIKIPKDAIRITTFDKVYDVALFGGKQIPLASDDLNTRSYQIGTFTSLEDLKTTNKEEIELFNALEKQGCIGMIKNASGEHPVFKFEKYIDISQQNKNHSLSSEGSDKE